MSIPDVVSTSFKVGPAGAAGAAGSSAANATPDVAKPSTNAGAISCFPIIFILLIPHILNIVNHRNRREKLGAGGAVATGLRLCRRAVTPLFPRGEKCPGPRVPVLR